MMRDTRLTGDLRDESTHRGRSGRSRVVRLTHKHTASAAGGGVLPRRRLALGNCSWPRSGRAVRRWLPSAVWAEGLADLGVELVRVLRGKEVATVLQHYAAFHGRVGAA